MPDTYGLVTTDESMLKSILDGDDATRQAALTRFLEVYLNGMYRYVRQLGLTRVTPEDVVHELVVDKIIGRTLIEQYLKGERRQFRKYLKASLHNKLRDLLRREGKYRPEDDIGEEAWTCSLDRIVGEEQVRFLTGEIVARVQEYYFERGQTRDWDLFYHRFIKPLKSNSKMPSYDSLKREFGLKKEPYSVIANVWRRFEKVRKEVLSEKLGTEDEAVLKDELNEIGRSIEIVRGQSIDNVLFGDCESDSNERHTDDETGTGVSGMYDLLRSSSPLTGAELKVFYDEWATRSFEVLFRENELRLPPQLVKNSSASYAPATSIKEVISDPDATLELLREIKGLVGKVLEQESSSVPQQVLLVMRYISIALAITRFGESISRLTKDDLTVSLNRLLEYDWIDEQIRSLFESAIQRLRYSLE